MDKQDKQDFLDLRGRILSLPVKSYKADNPKSCLSCLSMFESGVIPGGLINMDRQDRQDFCLSIAGQILSSEG